MIGCILQAFQVLSGHCTHPVKPYSPNDVPSWFPCDQFHPVCQSDEFIGKKPCLLLAAIRSAIAEYHPRSQTDINIPATISAVSIMAWKIARAISDVLVDRPSRALPPRDFNAACNHVQSAPPSARIWFRDGNGLPCRGTNKIDDRRSSRVFASSESARCVRYWERPCATCDHAIYQTKLPPHPILPQQFDRMRRHRHRVDVEARPDPLGKPGCAKNMNSSACEFLLGFARHSREPKEKTISRHLSGRSKATFGTPATLNRGSTERQATRRREPTAAPEDPIDKVRHLKQM